MTAVVHLKSWDKPPLTSNRVRGIPQARAREVARAKEEAIWWVRQAKLKPIHEPVVATLHYRLPDRRRRDADGWAPTLKVVLDALVAEAIIRDDSTAYVPEARLKSHPPTHGDGELWLTLEEVWQR